MTCAMHTAGISNVNKSHVCKYNRRDDKFPVAISLISFTKKDLWETLVKAWGTEILKTEL